MNLSRQNCANKEITSIILGWDLNQWQGVNACGSFFKGHLGKYRVDSALHTPVLRSKQKNIVYMPNANLTSIKYIKMKFDFQKKISNTNYK